MELRNEMQPREAQLAAFYGSGRRAGGRREDAGDSAELERVWRNGRLAGAPFACHDGWRVPCPSSLRLCTNATRSICY